jgi:hypothetical protein
MADWEIWLDENLGDEDLSALAHAGHIQADKANF